MSFEWVSYFRCGNCGLEKPSPEVPYDRLGYAVCPSCGVETMPVYVEMTKYPTVVEG